MANHDATRIDKANHLLLDQPLLRLPYELLRKNFRSAHFIVEKESTSVKNSLKEAATNGLKNAGSATSTDDVLKSLDGMVARMRGMKRKLEACADEEAKIYRQVDARTAHLAELASMHSLDDVAYETWSRRRLDRLLVDYLLRHGYNSSAAALVDDDASGALRDLVDIDTFANMSQIRQRLLRDHSVTEALAWCTDNKKELRKMESKLEFMLRFQQFIEMVRSQDLARLGDAVNHARRYLTPFYTSYPTECEQASALMCYPAAEAPHEYSDLWNNERWAMLANLFTSTHNQLLSLPSVPLLHLALSSGLSALKTPACHSSPAPEPAPIPTITGISISSISNGISHLNGNGASQSTSNGASSTDDSKLKRSPFARTMHQGQQMGTSICPICSIELNQLARHVPYAHHSKSHVEHDLKLLPNGHAYGMERLLEYARKTGLPADQIRDLRTNEIFHLNDAKKVFIT
ncbi:GID complex subunit containing RING finger motif [Sporothrix stenoceras]|uniref:GID complex subunit containing RING finger motif n=1 Tax=Sporothrix stenoceras TaxID=5173 RepID=A0ABR3Z3Q0_9PEZI